MHPENLDAIISLYMRMPGAPKPSYDPERGMLWGECKGNEHWEFCREIVRLVGKL